MNAGFPKKMFWSGIRHITEYKKGTETVHNEVVSAPFLAHIM